MRIPFFPFPLLSSFLPSESFSPILFIKLEFPDRRDSLTSGSQWRRKFRCAHVAVNLNGVALIDDDLCISKCTPIDAYTIYRKSLRKISNTRQTIPFINVAGGKRTTAAASLGPLMRTKGKLRRAVSSKQGSAIMSTCVF
jgi:hypothetical protein